MALWTLSRISSHSSDSQSLKEGRTDPMLCSIIAVVGLGTHAFGTFRSAEHDVMWLRDFLGKDVPKIRVLLYGYNSVVDESKTHERIEQYATTCLNLCHEIRVRTKVGPLEKFDMNFADAISDRRAPNHFSGPKSRRSDRPRGLWCPKQESSCLTWKNSQFLAPRSGYATQEKKLLARERDS